MADEHLFPIGAHVRATWTDVEAVPSRGTLGRIERGVGPTWAVALAGAAHRRGADGPPAGDRAGDRLRAVRLEAGMTQDEFTAWLEQTVANGGVAIEGRVVAAENGRVWMRVPGWGEGPSLVHGGRIEWLDGGPPPASERDDLEPFSARVSERVLHRKVTREGHGRPTAWARDGTLVSRGGRIVARTRTDLEDGAYKVGGKGYEPDPGAAGFPVGLPEEATGDLGAFELERPYTDLLRVKRMARPRASGHREQLAYLRLEVAEDGRTARITGTDGHRMARNSWVLDGEVAPGTYDWPLAAVHLFLREKRAPRVRVTIDEDRMTFANGNTTITAPWERDAMPDLEQVIPERVEFSLRFDQEAFRAAVGACREQMKDRSGHDGDFVHFIEREGGYGIRPRGDVEGEVFLEAERQEGGRVRRDQFGLVMPIRILQAADEGEEVAFGFNERYLYDFLRHMRGADLHLAGSGPSQAFVLYGAPIAY